MLCSRPPVLLGPGATSGSASARRLVGARPLTAPHAARPSTAIATAIAPRPRSAPLRSSSSPRPVVAARDAAASTTTPTTSLPLIDKDPALKPFEDHLSYRWRRYQEAKTEIELAVAADDTADAKTPPLSAFAESYKTWGLQRGDKCVTFREWIPGASAVALIGDFNNWQPRDGLDWAQKDEFAVWTLTLPDEDGEGGGKKPAIAHGSRYKLRVQSASGGWWADRVSAWARYAVAPQGQMGATFDGVAWWPGEGERHVWRHPRPPPLGNSSDSSSPQPALRIYEAHVGMSSEREEVASYKHFAEVVLPRVKEQGYNAVQLMAVQEHAYYASFGYHVTSPFAVSSRSGTPEDLKRLVDAAHSLGLRVLLDVVHSHASKNEADGIAGFDLGGGEGALVRTGDAGYHSLWDSRIFSYERLETKRYLLSNLKYWVCEMGFDGFRFDGVTSMLYQHHGIGVGFSGSYGEYFGLSTDVEACVYLMLANEMLHGLSAEGAGGAGAGTGGRAGSAGGGGAGAKAAAKTAPPSSSSSSAAAPSLLPPPPPDVLTIAEDVSGMPGLCAPVSEGGLGFDARLAMAAPDLWIRLLKHVPDEGWPVSQIVATLCGRRYGEGRIGTIGYSESHDQAMVGDKTIAMWLFGPEIYEGMSCLHPASPVIERGLALHKTISAATCALGGEARMTFMGNEFGHPEWIDFPTAQNGWSHKFARRQWSLADREDLRYGFLLAWDRALNAADDKHGFVSHKTQWATMIDDSRQLIVAERGDLVWVLNFSPHLAHGALRVPCPRAGKWRVVLDSDATCFGGAGRVPWKDYYTSPADEEEGGQFCGRAQWLEVVSPPRTAVAFVRVREEEVGTDSGDGASEAVFPPDYGARRQTEAEESEAASEQTAGGGGERPVVAAEAPAAEAPAASAAPSAGDAKNKGKDKDDDDGPGGQQRGDYVVFRF